MVHWLGFETPFLGNFENLKPEMKLIFTIIFTLNILKYSFSYECPANDKCEIWLNIEEKLTMTWGKIRVYAKDGALYKFDEHWSNATTIVSHLVNIQRRFNVLMAYREMLKRRLMATGIQHFYLGSGNVTMARSII